MQKILFFNSNICDFLDQKTQKRVHGLSIKGLEKDGENIKLCKAWVDASESHFNVMCEKADNLIPGQVVELDYSAVSPKKIILTDIIPSDDVAVVFDNIL